MNTSKYLIKKMSMYLWDNNIDCQISKKKTLKSSNASQQWYIGKK